MTADLDLSPEAVERLASQFDRCASIVDSVELPGAKIPFINTAATLRALSAKNARLRAERDAAWQAGAEAMRQAAINAVPSGWEGVPHMSGLDYGPTTAGKAVAAIRALPLPDQPKEGA